MGKIIFRNKVDWSATDGSGTTFGTFIDGDVCPKCRKPYVAFYPVTTGGNVCSCKPDPPKQGGWICPACGCGNAAWSSKCGHCVPKFEGTTGSTRGVE